MYLVHVSKLSTKSAVPKLFWLATPFLNLGFLRVSFTSHSMYIIIRNRKNKLKIEHFKMLCI